MAEPKPIPPRWLGGKRARLTVDQPGDLGGALTYFAAPDNESAWRDLSLDSRTLDRMAPADLVELLCDLSPDISRALWDWGRLCNPGWEAQALRPGSETVDARAQAALDAFLTQLGVLYGAPDVIFNRLYLAAWLRGGMAAELVLDQRGRMPVDLATPDPRWIYWRRKTDPARGRIWEPYQWVGGQPVSLDVPTVRYVPVDPLPGKPAGRPLAAPALFTAIFALSLLHDLRRVVQQQGYPRLDVSVNLERLLLQMPPQIRDDPAESKKWVDDLIDQVASAYEQLEPDDAYIHTDVVTVNRPVGTVDATSLGAIDGLIAALERMAVRGLKSQPLMMALPDGTSEANANRQWELVAAGVKSLQHLLEQLLEYLLTLALWVQGLQAQVRFRFAELRAAEMLRDAQVAQLQSTVAAFRYDRGWISQDESAKEGAGVDKADAPEPRVAAGAPAKAGNPANPAEVQADPGSNRAALPRHRGTEPVKPAGAALPPLNGAVAFSVTEIDAALRAWDAAEPDFAGLLAAEVVNG